MGRVQPGTGWEPATGERFRRLARFAPLAGLVIALSLLLPFVLHQNAWFEWSNALWLVERQAGAIKELGHPTYFLHTNETGAFYPQFLFYGGALFAATGALAALIGSAWWAFVAVLVLVAGCAYGSYFWIGRQVGLDRIEATLAALAGATSPYVTTILYGRGAWTEIVATAGVPLALAGGLATMRGQRPWTGVAAVAAAAALVAGSHNITVVWGVVVGSAIVAVALVAVTPAGIRRLSLRRALLVVGALVFGLGIAAWSLLPSAVYGRTTRAYVDSAGLINALSSLDRLDVVLRPYPFVPGDIAATSPAVKLQLPVYVLAWAFAVIAVALVRRRGSGGDRRMAIGLLVVLAALLFLLVSQTPWQYLPGMLTAIQFPLRLHAYVVTVAVLLTIVALRLVRLAPGRWVWTSALVLLLIVQTAFAQWAAWSAPESVHRQDIVSSRIPAAFAPYQRIMYLDAESTPLPPPSRRIALDAVTIDGDRVRVAAPDIRTSRFGIDIVVSPFVRARSPWRVVGRDDAGLAVVEGPRRRPAPAPEFEQASPWPVRLGSGLSLICLVFAAAGAVFCLARRLGPTHLKPTERTRTPGRSSSRRRKW